jgi:hypothetical protein
MSKKTASVVALIESLHGAPRPNVEEHEQLVALLFDAQYALLFAFIDFVPMDRGDYAAMLICKLAFPRRVLVGAVTSLVQREVQICTSSATLFRSNSMASRVIGHAARAMAKCYFRTILQEVLLSLTTAEPGAFEVDPDKISAGGDVLSNVAALTDVCSSLLDNIFKRVHQCPVPIRRLCAIMRDSVQLKYPQYCNIAIGSFFFLRFINPALLLPEQYDLVPSVAPHVRRSMVLITKVLQQLANELDSFKEQYMAPLSAFVRKNMDPLRQFYRDICACHDEVGFLQPDIEAEFTLCPDLNADMKSVTLEEKKAFYKLLHDKRDKITDRLPCCDRVLAICTANSLARFSKNIQEFELEIASMVVTYDPDKDDSSSVVSVASEPPVQPKSPTSDRVRLVSVSDTNYAIIQQTIEVSLVLLVLDALRMFTIIFAGTSHAGADGANEFCIEF